MNKRRKPMDPVDVARVGGAGDLSSYLDSSRTLVELVLELQHTAGPTEIHEAVKAAEVAEFWWSRISKSIGPSEAGFRKKLTPPPGSDHEP